MTTRTPSNLSGQSGRGDPRGYLPTSSSASPFSSLQFSSLFLRRQQKDDLSLYPNGSLDEGSPSPSNNIPPSSSSWFGSPSNPRSNPPSRTSTFKPNRPSTFASILSPNPKVGVEEKLDPMITQTFSQPDHIAAFREALEDDAGQQDPANGSGIAARAGALTASSSLAKLGYSASSSKSQERSQLHPEEGNGKSYQDSTQTKDPDAEWTETQPTHHPRKVGRIAAASDFAPVRERTKSRRKGRGRGTDGGTREGFVYKLLRFPLLLSIFTTIALEFAAYVLIRQIVNVVEYFVAWRGEKGRLRSRLRKATTASEWREVALELDEYLGYEGWKREDSSGLYDWILIKKVLNSMKAFRENDDADNLLGVLELCLRNNFAGTENFRLYSETFFGTKYLIESYLAEIEAALDYVQGTDRLSLETKRSFYRGVQKNLGRSALCLSGGGSFGYYHIGLVKALLDAGLLPSIVSGTSAGGLIAALTCTRTNEELKKLLVPELADRITACEEPFRIWAARAARTGARFDTVQWAEKAQFFTMGSLTFAEAYARTGKVLNISVIPSDKHSPVKLLNYHTAPNCIIWSSLLASSAVPGILNPVCLMQKTKSGQAVPWNWGHRFKDGSLRVDIPLQDLHSLFNVNYPIVSQVNPHVHLFFFAPKGMPGRPVAHRKGKGWRGGFVLSASEHVLKLHLSMNFKIIRDLDLLPAILGQDWSSVFLQPFGGAVTIWPKTRAWDWIRILTDPDRKELARMMSVGQSVTFPKLHMIENRVRLERSIESGRRMTRQSLRKHRASTNRGPAALSTTNGALSSVPLSASASHEGQGGASSSGYAAANLSDTDGTNEDFFTAEKPSIVSRRGPIARLQSINANKNDDGLDTPGIASGYATTPEEPPLFEGKGNGASRKVGDGPSLSTPGELPRHIRDRSMGMGEDDEHMLQKKVAPPSASSSEEESSGGEGGVGLAKLRERVTSQQGWDGHHHHHHHHHYRNVATGTGTAMGTAEEDWTKRGSMRGDHMKWLNDRDKPDVESSSSSSSEGEDGQ